MVASHIRYRFGLWTLRPSTWQEFRLAVSGPHRQTATCSSRHGKKDRTTRRPQASGRAGNYKIITVRDHSIPQKSSNSCYKMREREREVGGERERGRGGGPIKRFERAAAGPGLFRIFEIILQHLSSPPPAILRSLSLSLLARSILGAF